MVKKVHKWKLMSIRPQGRPKNRWEDDIRNYMKKLKIKNWISCIQDRIRGNHMLRRPKHSKIEVVAPKGEENCLLTSTECFITAAERRQQMHQ